MVLRESEDWVPEHECAELGCEQCRAEGYLGEIPAKYEVCSTCDGRGQYVNPAIDEHGITADEFAEDPDFAEDYHRGTFDVTCARGRRSRRS